MFLSLDNIRKSPLSLRLIFNMTVFSVLVIVFSAIIQIVLEYRQGKQAILDNLQLVESSYLQPLTVSTYNINEELLRIQLNGLIALEDIGYAEIIEWRAPEKPVIFAGDPNLPKDIERSFPMIFKLSSGFTQDIGVLNVAANLDGLRSQLSHRATDILFENLIRTLLIALFMFFLAQSAITRHLRKIATYTDNVSLDRLDQSLSLDRQESKRFRPDELDQIVSAANNLRLRLISDISERVAAEQKLTESEAQYRGLFERIPVGLYKTAPDGRILDANPAMIEMLGYPDKATLLTENLNDLIVDTERRDADMELMSIEDVLSKIEVEVRRYDGSNIWAWEAFRAERDDLGNVVSIGGSLEDITDRKTAETALRRAQKMDAIGQLTGGIAHDFNNILGIILGNLELLPDLIKQNEPALTRIEAVRKSAQRAADLTRQLLNVSRKNASHVEIVNINLKIIEMESLIKHSVTPEVELEQMLSEEIWLTGIDPGDFEDALINLVLNARDAMEAGGRLTLETANIVLDATYCEQNPGVEPGQYIQLAVSDNGDGISSDQQEHIFEPFFTTKPEGTGMGLSMVFGFIKRSRGHIKVYSEPDIGTTIRLYLPRSEGQHLPRIQQVDSLQSLPRGTETLLVVDDEEELLELARHSLEELGYKVLTAGDGKQALEYILSAVNIDLLFSDVVMPGGINGYELAEQATAHSPDLKVLLTSGYTEKAVAHNGQARFAAHLLSKPYTQVDLAQRLRLLLDADFSGSNTQAKVLIESEQLEWDQALNVGVDVLDEDHQKFLTMLSQIDQIVKQGGATHEISRILQQFRDYTQVHFGREEAIMAICEYPGLENHRQIHRMLTNQVEQLLRQFSSDNLEAGELLAFLSNWWIDHIRGMDLAYAEDCKGKEGIILKYLEAEKSKDK